MSRPKFLEESYSDRRKIFRNIFKNGFALDSATDGNASPNPKSPKPRIIKTMRMEELTPKSAERKKNLRLRNLRIICNKILDYCDHEQVYDTNHVPKAPIRRRRCKHKVKKNRGHTGPPVQNNCFPNLYSPQSSPPPLSSSPSSPSPPRERKRKTTLRNSRIPRKMTTANQDQAAPTPKEPVEVMAMSVKRDTKPKRTSKTHRKLAKKNLESLSLGTYLPN